MEDGNSLNRIPLFSKVAALPPEKIQGASPQDRQVVYKVAQEVLQNLHSPQHITEGKKKEYTELSRFVHNMELFALEEDDKSPEAAAFRVALRELQQYRSQMQRQEKLYTFFTSPHEIESLPVVGVHGKSETRAAVIERTGQFLTALLDEAGQAKIPQKDLNQIYENLCAIGVEMGRSLDSEALNAFQAEADRFTARFRYPPLASILEKEELGARIIDLISFLGSEESNLREDVRKIKEDTAKLKKIYQNNPSAKEHLAQLEETLNELVRPQLTKISPEEFSIIREIGRRSYSHIPAEEREAAIERGVLRYSEKESDSIQKGKAEILKRLEQEAKLGFRGLMNSAPGLLEGIQEKAIQERFASISSKKSFGDDFVEVAPKLVKDIAIYGQYVRKSLKEKWEETLSSKRFDALGEPSQRQAFFDRYSYISPMQDLEGNVQEAVTKRLEGLPLNKASPKIFREVCKEHLEDHFASFFARFLPKQKAMLWLLSQIKHIVIPHNQSVDALLSSKGICLSSSLQRQSLLLDDPKTPLIFGGTEVARMRQIIYSLELPALPPEQIGNFLVQERQIAQSYRLNEIERKELALGKRAPALFAANKKTMIIQNYGGVVAEANQFALRHPSFLLSLRSELGGHAINVQIDPQNKLYRIVDDNIGICQYETAEELNEALEGLLSTFYSGMAWDDFTLQAYARQKRPA